MSKAVTLNDLLESADKLSLDEQETLTEVLHRRIIERRRSELVKDIQDAQLEFKERSALPASPSEMLQSILDRTV